MQCVGYEALTVSTAAVKFASFQAGGALVGANPQFALIRVETNPVRVRGDGTAPTAAVGLPLNATDTPNLTQIGDVRNLQFIRSGASDGVVHALFYTI